AQARIHGQADARAPAPLVDREIEACRRSRASPAEDAAAALREDARTIREHYKKKREHYGLDYPDFYDRDLRNLFSASPAYAKKLAADKFVSKIRKEVRTSVASFTDSYQYTIDQLISRIVKRCRELNLHLMDTEKATKPDFMVFLT